MSFRHDQASITAPDTWATDPRYTALPTFDLHQIRPHEEGGGRLVVVSAHPDDETLGAFGLMRHAHQAAAEVTLVVLTDGEHSHPHSRTFAPARLGALRREEVTTAVEIAAPGTTIIFHGVEDGTVQIEEERLVARLVELLGDARDTVVAAPWRRDGHPDHDAAGRVARVAAYRTGAVLLEYPVWWWHWATPAQAPWGDLVRLRLDAPAVELKKRAIDAHRTQVRALSDRPGDEALLRPEFLAHFTTSHEVFLRAPVRPEDDTALDALHRREPDPWRTSSWYERRKRDLTTAILPRERFRRALEVGCSVGALSEALAARCDEVVAIDQSTAAVDLANRRLACHPRAHAEVFDAPASWPDGEFDLVVVSETAYFLSPVAVDGLVDRIRSCLTADGVVVSCHWTHPIVGWVLDGREVNQRITAGLNLTVTARYDDTDVEMLALSASPDQTAR